MTTAVATTAVVGCPDCGTRQELSPLGFGDTLYCVTCHSPLERRYGQSLTAALCCASATLLLLVPANLEIFLMTEAFGASRHSYLSSTAGAILDGGWPWLALAIFLFVVVFPVVRFALLTTGTRPTLSEPAPPLAGTRLPLGQPPRRPGR